MGDSKMYIGVDTHKREHVLVALDAQGRLVATQAIPNTAQGWALGWEWAARWEGRHWAIENSGSWGKGFAQSLLGRGEAVVHEVSPHRTAQYRRRSRTQDKTDETDALAIARLLLAEGEHLPRVQADDLSTELRMLSEHRDNLLGERTRLINQLHAQMLQVDPSYQAQSGRLTAARGMRYCRDLALPAGDRLLQARLLIVHQLAEQLLNLNETVALATAALTERVRESRTPFLAVCGVGTLVAARLVGELGTTPRVPSAAAFAALAGVAPVAVSSGGHGGYRLNRGGNRQLNRAIHIIALAQCRLDVRAQQYYAKKRAEGKTRRAALRCLKRRLVDVLFRTLRQSQSTSYPLPAGTEPLDATLRSA
jgi:transposase